MTKPKYGLLLTPTEAMAYDEQRDAARAMLAALQALTGIAHEDDPEVNAIVGQALAAIAQAEAAGIT